MEQINRNRLFIASCFALITTALAFGIRAGIMTDLVKDMQLNDTQLGWINFMGAFGFPIATLVGGSMYNHFGPKTQSRQKHFHLLICCILCFI